MRPTVAISKSYAPVLTPAAPFAGLLAVFQSRWASEVAGGNLQRQLDALLAEAREAGSEAGAWDMSDEFLVSLEPRLRRLVCPSPAACDPDPALVAKQVEELTTGLQRLQGDAVVLPSSAPAWLMSGVPGVLTIVACGVVALVVLHLWGLPLATTAFVGLALCAGGRAVTGAAARWIQSGARRQRNRRRRRLQNELAALEAEGRRALLRRARLDRWVADSRDLVEAEYRRYRTRASRAMGPAIVSRGARASSLPHADIVDVLRVVCHEGGCHAGH